ncbi:MAG: methyltransferase [Candidatus Lokiarchaeota archaeon]|jgi:protein-S-isoprenylcysteine O-methyltransferase Ste14
MITKTSTIYFFMSVFFTIGAFFLSSLTRLELQAYLLWKSVDYTLFSGYVDFTLFFFIHNFIGAFIFLLGFYQCLKIVKINNQVHNGKNKPNLLLKEGYYAVVRHPMTARFLFIFFAFLFMMGSLFSLLIYILFQVIFLFLTIYEEKKIIYPIFGEEYTAYKKKVKHRFFNRNSVKVLSLLILFMMIGSFFTFF